MSTSDQRASLFGFDWNYLAYDADGRVAVVASSGYGPIPEAVPGSRAMVERAVYELVPLLPPFTDAVPSNYLRHSGAFESDWSEYHGYSERGLFVFDWDSYQGPFHLMCQPRTPLTLAALPDEIGSVARLAHVANMSQKTLL